TLGLFLYELYGIKKCDRLIRVGKELEGEKLGIDGQFKKRPREVAFLINEPFAAGVIYPAVLSAWMFLALVFKVTPTETKYDPQGALWWAIYVFMVGFAISFFFNLWLKLAGKLADKLKVDVEKVTIRYCLKTKFARLTKRKEEPNIGAILIKLLNI